MRNKPPQTPVKSQRFKVSSSYSVNNTKVRTRQPCATDRDSAFISYSESSVLDLLSLHPFISLFYFTFNAFWPSVPPDPPTKCGDPGVGFHGCFKAYSTTIYCCFFFNTFFGAGWEKSFLLVYFINQSVLTGSLIKHVGSLINQTTFSCSVVFFASSIRLFASFPFSCRKKERLSVVTSTPKRKDLITSCVQKYLI